MCGCFFVKKMLLLSSASTSVHSIYDVFYLLTFIILMFTVVNGQEVSVLSLRTVAIIFITYTYVPACRH